MRIAIVTQEFPPMIGGISEYVSNLARELAYLHEVAVWSPPPLEYLEPEGEEHDPPYKRFNLPRGVWAISRALRQWRPDRIIVGHTDLKLLLVARWTLPGRYVAITYGNDFLGAQRTWYRGLVNHLLAQARPLVTISHSSAERLRALGIPNPVVIHAGTDPQRFSPPSTPPPPPFTLLSVGRLEQRKGLDVAIRAVAELHQRHPNVRYLIGGRGPERPHLQHLARELGMDKIVHFLDKVPPDELPDLYRKAHVFVLPLREEHEADTIEGFGMVFLEAAATAVPSVAGRMGGAVEAIRDGETGILVPPGDVASIVETVDHLIHDETLRRRLGRNGRRWVEEEMNWARVARDFDYWLTTLSG